MTMSPPTLAPVKADRAKKSVTSAIVATAVLGQLGNAPSHPARAARFDHYHVLPVVPDLLVAAVLSEH